MLLTGHNIAHYLLDKGYLSPADIVEARASIEPVSSRNHSFRLRRPEGPSLFIKQVKALEAEKTETLRTEANCYWLAQNDEAFAPVRPWMPTLLEYDYNNHILITENIEGARSLQAHYKQTGGLSPAIAGQMAVLLARLHGGVGTAARAGNSRQLFQESMPGIFMLNDQNLKFFSKDNEAGKLFVRLISENRQYLPLIQAVGKEWEAGSLLHGDIKPANFLLKGAELFLIDWEIAFWGDPCWDVAGALQSYLLFWIEHNLQQRPEYSVPGMEPMGFSLEEVLPSIHTFWEAYARESGFDETQAQAMLGKAIRFCALKLIHTCTEATQQSEFLQPAAAAMLQLSFNLLNDPEEALVSLFQFPQKQAA